MVVGMGRYREVRVMNGKERKMRKSLLRNEDGMAIIIALVMLTLMTSLGMAAMLLSQMDMAVSGNYRMQRTGEVAADGGLELAKAMIFNDDPMLNLPISVDGTWAGSGDVAYTEGDIDITINVDYKLEDTINYNGTEVYADEVVRYGKDYNFMGANKDIGKQPVYTVTFTDDATGIKAEADLISSLGFKTPAAVFVKGKVDMMKNPYATEETIEITSATGTPALATASPSSDVYIQKATSLPDNSGSYRSYRDQNGSTHTYYTNAGYLHARVYDNQAPGDEIAAAQAAGNHNDAKNMMHVLLGVGDPTADLDADPFAFNFDVTDTAVVRYNYPMPGSGKIEEMIGADIADFRDLSDQIIVGNENVQIANGSWVSDGKDLSGMTFGTAASPQIVFMESNMNDDGTYIGGQRELTLATTGGSVQGFGILVINGDANIQGSISWTGLMLVRGDLMFRPWQGGTPASRSGPELASRWNGFIMIGGDLELWTWYGGSLYLGFTDADVAAVKGIIAATIPHKVLSWRRIYD